MVITVLVMKIVYHHLDSVLLAAEAALTPDQFRAFRKLVLKEFGKDRLQASLQRLFASSGDRYGQE